ncbi:hypothetical protein O3P69_005940 [Scylla paramamosain]|uniref:Uncharacterized protein n=1 Tax=Scylla paramamosain TaxID=85552 RepID=A0AAW0U495_SCYPA
MMAQLNPGLAVLLCVVVAAPLTTATSEFVPQIPASQEESPLANLWKHALKEQGAATPTERDDQGPKTFIAPDYGVVINWVPQDSAHPLYAPQYINLLREILLDYMVQVVVKPDDPRMSQPNGLQVINRNGRTITFKRVVSGDITVNGKKVVKSTAHKDGTFSYILDKSLFGHRETVHEVWQKYIETVPVYDPFRTLIAGPRAPPPEKSETAAASPPASP